MEATARTQTVFRMYFPPSDGSVRITTPGTGIQRRRWRSGTIHCSLYHDRQIEHERAPRAEEVRERPEEIVRLLSFGRRGENDRQDV